MRQGRVTFDLCARWLFFLLRASLRESGNARPAATKGQRVVMNWHPPIYAPRAAILFYYRLSFRRKYWYGHTLGLFTFFRRTICANATIHSRGAARVATAPPAVPHGSHPHQRGGCVGDFSPSNKTKRDRLCAWTKNSTSLPALIQYYRIANRLSPTTVQSTPKTI